MKDFQLFYSHFSKGDWQVAFFCIDMADDPKFLFSVGKGDYGFQIDIFFMEFCFSK